jgi:hypothetical protein
LVSATTTLDELADAAAKAFAQVAGRLGDVRGATLDLCTRLEDLDRVLVGQSGNVRVLAVVEAGALSLREALAEGSTVAVPERLARAAFDSQSQLAEIASRTKQLDAVATLTLVAARSLDLPGFDDYVRDLRGLSALVRDDAGQLATAVADLRDRRETAAALYRQASLSLDRVVGIFASVADERASTEEGLKQSLRDVSALAARLPAVAEAEIEELVRAMQFADTVAQRLDHVRTIMSHPAPAAQALAGAQIAALVAEIRETGTRVAASLDRIATEAGAAVRVLSAGDGPQSSPAAQALNLGRKVLSEVAEGAQITLAAIAGTVEEAQALRALSDQAALRFTSLMHTTEAIHIAAVNAVLLARRDDGHERAMGVLSIEVRHQAGACAAASSSCRGSIGQLSLPDDLQAFAAVADSGASFRRAVGETEGAVETAGLAMVELDRLREAAESSLERLAAATADARQALEALYRSADSLSHLSGSLPDGVPAGDRDVAHLMDIYTMESERAVHRRLFGIAQPVEPAAAQPADADDPLAAILF